jgi:hypothetical protein
MTTLFGVGAVLLIVLGCWGWRAVPGLVSRSLDAESRRHQEGVLRRGVLACFAASAILLAFVVASLVS